MMSKTSDRVRVPSIMTSHEDDEFDKLIDDIDDGDFGFLDDLDIDDVIPSTSTNRSKTQTRNTQVPTPVVNADNNEIRHESSAEVQQLQKELQALKSKHEKMQSDFFSAKGENSILRSKLNEVEKRHSTEVNQMAQSQNTYRQRQEQELSDLNHQLERLKTEKTFNMKEKKKIKSNNIGGTPSLKGFPDQIAPDLFKKKNSQWKTPTSQLQVGTNKRKRVTKESDVTTIQTDNAIPPSDLMFNKDIKMKTVVRPIPLQPSNNLLIPNEPVLLVDYLLSHIITGARFPTMEYLSRIKIQSSFSHGDLLISPKDKDFAKPIISFICNGRRMTRLDKLVCTISETILELTFQCYSQHYFMVCPFLLALVHCCISFRPAAVSEKLIDIVMKFTYSITKLSDWAITRRYRKLKNEEDPNFFLYSNKAEDFSLQQDEYLNNLCSIYTMDILEKLAQICCSSEKFVTKLWSTIDYKFLSGFFPQVTIDSVQSGTMRLNNIGSKLQLPICILFNLIEMLASSALSNSIGPILSTVNDGDNSLIQQQQHDIKLLDTLINLFVEPQICAPGFNFYSLNRILGDGSDWRIISSLFPVDEKDNKKLETSFSKQSGSFSAFFSDSSNKLTIGKKESFRVQTDQDIQYIKLRLKLVECLQTIISERIDDNNNYDEMNNVYSGINLFICSDRKLLYQINDIFIWSIALEQEYIIQAPHSALNKYRIELISDMVEILHLTWKANDDFQGFIRVLSRISLNELQVIMSRIGFRTSIDQASFLIQNSYRAQKQDLLVQLENEKASQAVFNIEKLFFANSIENSISYRWKLPAIPNKVLQLNTNTKNNEKRTETESDSEDDYDDLIIEPNGLEIKYSDDTMELARDILEMCMTMEEADNLYFAMNAS